MHHRETIPEPVRGHRRSRRPGDPVHAALWQGPGVFTLVATILLVTLASWTPASRVWAADDGGATTLATKAQRELARKIKAEIMAPCCWNGTVDTHESAIAHQIAADIDRRVAAGETEDEIVDRLVERYGERILARPRTRGLGILFYVLPAILVVVTGVGLGLWLSRSSRGTGAEEPPEEIVADGPSSAPGDLDARFEEALRRLQER